MTPTLKACLLTLYDFQAGSDLPWQQEHHLSSAALDKERCSEAIPVASAGRDLNMQLGENCATSQDCPRSSSLTADSIPVGCRTAAEPLPHSAAPLCGPARAMAAWLTEKARASASCAITAQSQMLQRRKPLQDIDSYTHKMDC